MKWAAAAAMLAAALLLTGCGASRPRPTRPASHGHATVPATTAGGRNAGFHDDINKPQESRYRDSTDSVPGGPPPDLDTLAELASYYGNKFQGYKTSDLENYDMYAYSAASKTLPLPSYARVTNLENGKSVIVRVNDRGPFHRGRVIDLSYAAAVKIGIWPKGVGRVEVQGIDPDQLAGELPPPPAVTSAHSEIYLQVGAFSDAGNADLMVRRLRRANIAPVSETESVIDGRRVHRVRVGPLPGLERADQVSVRIENMGLPRPQVAVD